MVLPALYDVLLQNSRAETEKNTSHGPCPSSSDDRKQKQPWNTPKKWPVIRCVTPWNDENSGISKASVDERLRFPDSDVDSLSYTYSVGPFAHEKSEGMSSLSSKVPCWTLKDFTQDTTSEALLGSGKFGSVQLRHTRSMGKVALKILDKSTFQDQSMWKREVEIQTRLMHACILPSFGYFQSHTSLYIVLDCCSGGDLATWITQYQPTNRECKCVISQLASALAYLQQLSIAHRDVKTENVLLSAKDPLQCKLADFGYAVHCPDSDFRDTLCGTLACLPPEMLASPNRYYHAMTIDTWSLGVLAHELVLAEPVFPWPGSTTAMKEQIRNFHDPSLCVRGSIDFSHFVSSLLRRNPANRMTPQQALQHAWLMEKPIHRSENFKGTKRRRLDF